MKKLKFLSPPDVLISEVGWAAVRAGATLARMDAGLPCQGDGVSNAEVGDIVIELIKSMPLSKLDREFASVMKNVRL